MSENNPTWWVRITDQNISDFYNWVEEAGLAYTNLVSKEYDSRGRLADVYIPDYRSKLFLVRILTENSKILIKLTFNLECFSRDCDFIIYRFDC